MENLLLNQDELIDQYVMYTTTDLDGNITDASTLFCKYSGYQKSEIIGKPHNIFRDPDTPKSFYKNMWDTIKANKTWKSDVKNMTKKGNFYIASSIITPIFDNKTGNKIGYKSIKFDKTSSIELEKKVLEMDVLFHQIEIFLEDDTMNKKDLLNLISSINYSCNLQKPCKVKEPEMW